MLASLRTVDVNGIDLDNQILAETVKRGTYVLFINKALEFEKNV